MIPRTPHCSLFGPQVTRTPHCSPFGPHVTRTPVGSSYIRPSYGYGATRTPIIGSPFGPSYYSRSYSRPFCGFSSYNYPSYYSTTPRHYTPVNCPVPAAIAGIFTGALVFAALL